jgi:hypothetical protein
MIGEPTRVPRRTELLFFAFADSCTGQAEKLLKLAGHELVVTSRSTRHN